MGNPADEHGSDISSYPEATTPGTAESIADGTPVVGGVTNLAQDIYGTIAGDDRLSSAAGIPGDIMSIGTQAMFAVRDPVYALASAGLTIVLELIEPLNKLLEMVSGDPDAMARQGEVWGQVASALEALSGETGSAVGANIISWEGEAATAGQEQLYALEAAIMAASHEATSIQTLLGWAQMLAEAIYGCIKSILAELLSWLITRGLVALANSAWTAGASVATFLLGAAAKSFAMFNRAMTWFQKSCKLFGKIGQVLMKFLGKNPFRGINPANGFELAGGQLWTRVLVTAGVKAGTGLLQGAGTGIGTGSTAASNAYSRATYDSRGAGDGRVTVEVGELEGAAASLEGLSGNAAAIHSTAAEATAAEMTWGLPGALGFESAYRENGEGLSLAITAVEDALNGDAVKLRGCAEDYTSADDEGAAELNTLLSELES
ncbi:hypothetical protein [Glycomyces xiaoerkulensis]|uniref:hypothetical protein n=1 Tax=Glycomyces xiaoerkulensis TaxID=2038139 RepID=UPI000C258AD3|nr:hypothetical protein [Glycomyces xiaoerkulensis]